MPRTEKLPVREFVLDAQGNSTFASQKLSQKPNHCPKTALLFPIQINLLN